MWSKQVSIHPLRLRRLFAITHIVFWYLMTITYSIIDNSMWLKSKLWSQRQTNSVKMNLAVDDGTSSTGNNDVTFENLQIWLNRTTYQRCKEVKCSIVNAVVEIALTGFWSAHNFMCCQTYQNLSFEEKKQCVRLIRIKCQKIHKVIENAKVFSRLSPSVDLLMQDICGANEESLILFFNELTKNKLSEQLHWAGIYANCRLRSKYAEKGMFPASVAVHGVFGWCDKETSNMYGNLFSREYRLRICLSHPLAFFTCEKCVYPYQGSDVISTQSASVLLERSLHVFCEGGFRRQFALQLDRNSCSYRDNLTIDLSLNTTLGFIVSEWPLSILERLLWIAEEGSKHFSIEFWTSLKEMRKKLIADLRKTDVRMLIYYSMAGVLYLDGQSDKFFRLIGNEEAPVRLRCQLPKPKFDDILCAGLAKMCKDGTYVMCDIPGVEGYFKAVNVGESLLFVSCSQRVPFQAKRWQTIL